MAVILPTGQRMCIQDAALSDLPAARSDREFFLVRHMRKHSTSRASHATLQMLHGQPIQGLANLRTQGLRDWLQVVMAEFVNRAICVCSKALDCSSFCI